MNADTADDLKQFIATLISQQHASLRHEICEDLRQDLREIEDRLGQRIDDLTASVAVAIDSNNEDADARFDDHQKRMWILEQKAA